MRLRAAALACIFTVSVAVAGLPMMASAASVGTDVVETFEKFNSSAGLAGRWKPTTPPALTINLDTKTSAPNRGDGKSNGNYRSLRADFDLSKQDGWAFFRLSGVEEPRSLVDIINANKDVYLTFGPRRTRR